MPAGRRRLDAVVFFTGASVMVLELTGSRVLAPFVGTSIYTWTSLIGVILGCLSLGYFLGGRLADKSPSFTLLSNICLTAALLTAMVVVLQFPVLSVLASKQVDLRLSGLIATLLLFAAPSTALGMICPLAVRLMLQDIGHSGRDVGRLYALSTLGSLAGTFAAGYFIFAFLGSSATLIGIALVLFGCSIAADWTYRLPAKVMGLLLILGIAAVSRSMKANLEKGGLFDLDTMYQRVFVLTEKKSERTSKLLITDVLGTQSVMYIDAPEELAGEYTKYFQLLFHFSAAPQSVLMIGGGAYSIPKYFTGKYPGLRFDVVEIDPGITEIARAHFMLTGRPNLRIFHEDARTYLNRRPDSYDAVFLDAFQSSPSIPFHLTTKQMFEEVRSALKPDGVLMMNVIAAIEGDEGRLLRALYATLRSVFAEVYVIAVANPEDGRQVQNLLVIAALQPVSTEAGPASMHRQYLDRLWHKPIAMDMPILTDDFAPVENYMLPAYVKWQGQYRTKG